MQQQSHQDDTTNTTTATQHSEPEHPPALLSEGLRRPPAALRLRVSGSNRLVSVPRSFVQSSDAARLRR